MSLNSDSDNTIVLHQSSERSDLKTLVAETWNCALLDCGASKTVCGTEWLEQYCLSLTEEQKNLIEYYPSTNTYRFGDGKRVVAQKSVVIPATIGNTELKIHADVVNSDIPLLLSRDSMKKANMSLDFEFDIMTVFGEKIQLITTTSGHYALPISKSLHLANEIERGSISNITLKVETVKSNREIAIKLHRQFGHALEDKLLTLIQKAGQPWCDNKDLMEEIKEVCKNCETCQRYKKPPARPVVALPTATRFKETVALDLKFYNGNILLHLIDHATRLGIAAVIPNKRPETIVKNMLRHFIQVFGNAESFLTDNGGEFVNKQFLELCDVFGIKIKTTAAESPWSNGLIERHNLILSNMLDKVINDVGCNLDIAVAWCCNAKNSLYNLQGFSPYQLAIGSNPILPNALESNLPSLTNKPSNLIIKENLEALHKAREAFIQSENSVKIKRALAHPVRTSGDVKYLNGDRVYYKRKDSRAWHGPAVVLGQDGQQVLLKHGGIYVRVHPCRLNLVKSNLTVQSDNVSNHQSSSDAQLTQSKDNAYPNDDESDDDVAISIPQGLSVDTSSSSNSQISEQQVSTNDTTNDIAHPIVITNDSPEVSEQVSTETQLRRSTRPRNVVNYKEMHEGTIRSKTNNQNENSKSNSPLEHTASQVEQIYSDLNDTADKSLSALCNQFEENFKPNETRHSNAPNAPCPSVNTLEISDHDILRRSLLDSSVPNPSVNESISTNSVLPSEILATITKTDSIDEIKAKQQELSEWKKRNVYTEIEDKRQNAITLRWVLKDKTLSDGNVIKKARLCARGFQEEQDFRTDSPTCSKEGIRAALTIIASNKWKFNSMDVKTAFLQGKLIERDVFVKPPKESETNVLWKLNKCVYGLADASRYWYLKFREELMKLKAVPCSLDQALFMWYDDKNQLIGITICFVDDVIWAGDETFKSIISAFKTIFHIGSENQASFKFIGINLTQLPDFSIQADQYDFISAINYIPITPNMKADLKQPVTDTARKELRSALGQLNWLAGMTRPEISFYTCSISTHIKNATVADLIATNKVIRFVKEKKSHIKFPSMDLSTLSIIAYADASWNNLPNGGSQGGQLVFLKDANNSVSPVLWSSTRIKRVARSTLAAESLSVLDGCDSAFFVGQLVSTILRIEKIPVLTVTDSDSLYDTSSTTKQVLDRRLRVEISAIREMCEKDEVKLVWVDSKNQLSDVFTKKGASSDRLMQTIQSGQLHHVMLSYK